MTEDASYIPALRFRGLTRFYDRLLGATLKEDKFKALLIRQADIRPGHRVLDVGCGTAPLTVMLRKATSRAFQAAASYAASACVTPCLNWM